MKLIPKKMESKRQVLSVAAVLAAALLAGCASTADLPPAPAQATATDYPYIIGAGGSVNIIVWRNPELWLSVPVRPDGKIAAPLVDEVMAQGKTSVELARDVEKVLGKYVRDPIVTVLINGFVRPYSEQIRVLGEAARPQALPYKAKMTVLDHLIYGWVFFGVDSVPPIPSHCVGHPAVGPACDSPRPQKARAGPAEVFVAEARHRGRQSPRG